MGSQHSWPFAVLMVHRLHILNCSANLQSRAHHYNRRLSLVWGALIWAECVRSHAFRMGLSSKAKDGCSQRQHLNLQSNSIMFFSPFLSNGGKLGGNQEKKCLSGRFI